MKRLLKNTKNLQILWWILVGILLFVVLFLIFGRDKNKIENPGLPNNILTGNNETKIDETDKIDEIYNETTTSGSFEDEFLNDLDAFFNGDNGYENIEWEFWFTNPDAE